MKIPGKNEESTLTIQARGNSLNEADKGPDEITQKRLPGSAHASFLVASGILLSRLVGLLRQRIFAHYFGMSPAAGAFYAAFRIPNLLQNVLGEGVLSASFIPVYSRLLAEGDDKAARRAANAIFTSLVLIVSIAVLIGVLTTPYLITVIAPGFHDESRDLTIRLVKIFFPGAGLFVLSAWCLGVLNSHRRFFLSYTAPVFWNLVMIVSLIIFGGRMAQFPLAETAAWASVIGSALQFGVQLPTVMRLVPHLRPVFKLADEHTRKIARNFVPVFISRGVVQISAYVDSMLASFVGPAAVAALGYTQSLYTLPVSLFGMSISAAELPAMARALGDAGQVAEQLAARMNSGLRRIALFIIPSSMAFIALGDVMTAVLYQSGKFTRNDVFYVWGILIGSTVGLLASSMGRLYSSAFYALHDTRTPLRFAVLRVFLTTVLGYFCVIHLPGMLGFPPRWGVAGLTASAGLAGWVEFILLRSSMTRRIGWTGLTFSFAAKLWIAAASGALCAWGIKLVAGSTSTVILAVLVLIPYGIVYFAVARALGIPEACSLVEKVVQLPAKFLRR